MPKGFDLVDYILKKKGLYEESEEPVGDGTPSDEKKGEGEEGLEPTTEMAVQKLISHFDGKKRKRSLREGKKPCNECDEGMGTGGAGAAKDVVSADVKNTGPEPTDEAVSALKDWFNMTEEDSAVSNEEEPKGLTDAEAKADNATTIVDQAKDGAPNSPPAEIKEAVRTLRKMAKRLREEAEDDEKAAEGMEDEAESIEDKVEGEEKKDELKEWAIKLRKKSRRLREEAEEAVEKADALADKAEDVAAAEEDKEDDEEDSEAEEAVTEWTRNIAATGRKMIRENRAKKLLPKLVKLMEEEEVGMGTPGGVDLNGDFGDANDDGTAKRAAAAAPTTEDELGDELPD